MPLITDVKPQAKRQGYYNIFIDGKYALALSEADLSLFSLLPNQSIDDSTLADLHRAHSGSKCYNCAIRFLAIRPRSTTEVIAYLTTRKGYDAQDAKQACDKLTQHGYLDDIEFADMWVRNRMLLSPKPVSVLRMELASKGVDNCSSRGKGFRRQAARVFVSIGREQGPAAQIPEQAKAN